MDLSKRKTVGIALGGGVVRGFAHLGVLSALIEAGIPIDFIAGTSAGSVVGASFCAGKSISEIKDFSESLHWWSIGSLVWPRRGFISFMKLERRLADWLGDPTFADLKLPFAAVAADMENGEPVVLHQGRVAPAVRASSSVPGLIVPAVIDGRMLGDGSLVDTVPANVVRKMGAEYVIGVDIFSSAIHPRLGPFGMGYTAVEILIQRAGGGIESADCLIRPNLGGKTYINFSTRLEFFELGREAALAKLDQIRESVYSNQYTVSQSI